MKILLGFGKVLKKTNQTTKQPQINDTGHRAIDLQPIGNLRIRTYSNLYLRQITILK